MCVSALITDAASEKVVEVKSLENHFLHHTLDMN